MKLEPADIEALTIRDVESLDPILVVLQDLGPGRGQILVTCHEEAWHAFWTEMPESTVRERVTGCCVDYLVRRLLASRRWRNRHNYAYLVRIVETVQEALTGGAENV